MLRGRLPRFRQLVVSIALYALALAAGIALAAFAFVRSPGFLEYQAKARRSEARIALAALAGAEKAFYSEYASYTASFRKLGIGYRPEGQRRFYAIGFPTACLEKWHVPESEGFVPTGDSVHDREIRNFFRTVRKPADCGDLGAGFEVYAVGFPWDGEALEIWRIDEHGNLEPIRVKL